MCVLVAGILSCGTAAGRPVKAAEPAASPPALSGLWLSQDHDGVFRIEQCGDVLCGQLVAMRYDGSVPPLDRQGQSQCGLTMLTGFKRDEDDPARWNGHILDPTSGRVYHAQIWSPRPGELNLRGYLFLPLFGQTQHWTRFRGRIGPQCRLG